MNEMKTQSIQLYNEAFVFWWKFLFSYCFEARFHVIFSIAYSSSIVLNAHWNYYFDQSP